MLCSWLITSDIAKAENIPKSEEVKSIFVNITWSAIILRGIIKSYFFWKIIILEENAHTTASDAEEYASANRSAESMQKGK